MNTFKAFLVLEFKRLFSRRNMIVLGVFAVLSVYLIYTGVQQYNDLSTPKKEFREIERLKAQQFINWEQYGGYGIRLYFMPSPINILFYNSSLFDELTCRIDVGEELNIYSLFKGKNVFSEKSGRFLDFSGLILFLGSLMALFYGYDAIRDEGYVKFLASMYGYRRTFFCIWGARTILLCLVFVISIFATILFFFLWGKIDSIIIIIARVSVFLPMIFLPMILVIELFFFTIGTIAGTFEKNFSGGLFIIICWILSIYLLPAVLNKVVEVKAQAKKILSYYNTELEKIKTLMAFEQKAKPKTAIIVAKSDILKDLIKRKIKTNDLWKAWLKEWREKKDLKKEQFDLLNEIESNVVDSLKKPDPREIKIILDEFYNKKIDEMTNELKTMTDNFLNKEFPNIQHYEIKLQNGVSNTVGFYRFLSSFFPTTFYNSLNKELGSRGYESLLAFYKYGKEIKDDFVKFYTGKKFLRQQVVSFVQEKEKKNPGKEVNVFTGTPRFPRDFILGFIFSIAWCLGTLRYSYLRYKKYIFRISKEDREELTDLEIDVNEKESHVVLTNYKIAISNHLFAVLSGRNLEHPIGKVFYQGTDIVTDRERVDFVYLCHPEDLPDDIKAGDFALFIWKSLKCSEQEWSKLRLALNLKEYERKSFGELMEKEKSRVFLHTALLKKSKVYLFHDFAKGMPADFKRELREKLGRIKNDGGSILYITNDVFLGRRIGDFISFLKKDAASMTIIF
jgi:hypothetical protein